MKLITLTTGVIASALCAIACGSAAPTTATSPTSSGTGSLSGVVTTNAGVPLAGARVSIQPNPNSLGPSVVADIDGHYRFDSLPTGNTQVIAQAVRFQSTIGHRAIVNGTNLLNFVLPPLPQVILSGAVRDADTGAPVAGATVTFLFSPGSFANDGMTTVSRTDGTYVFDMIFAANSNLSAAAAGYQEWRTGLNISGDTTLDFLLRQLPQPQVFTGSVGGAPSTWTCTTKVPFGRDTIDAPCQDFAFTMRRPGSVDVTLTWPSSSMLAVQLVPASGQGTPGNPSIANAPNRVDATWPYVYVGTYALRVVNPPPSNIATAFTVTLIQRD